MCVRIILDPAAPGVQYTEKTGKVAAHETLVRFKCAKRSRSAVHDCIIDGLLITPDGVVQLVRQCERCQEVSARQQIGLLAVHPFGRFVVLAHGAVPVAAGSVGCQPVAAVGTLKQVLSAEPGTALAHSGDGLSLKSRHSVAETIKISFGVILEYALNRAHDTTPRISLLIRARDSFFPAVVRCRYSVVVARLL